MYEPSRRGYPAGHLYSETGEAQLGLIVNATAGGMAMHMLGIERPRKDGMRLLRIRATEKMRCLICGSGSEIAAALKDRLEHDGWEVHGASGRSLITPQGKWDLLILAHGQLTPIDRFFECDMSDWMGAIMVNAVYPLSCLRAAWPQRNEGAMVVFISGPNMSRPSPTYSAYRAGKAILEAIAGTLEVEYPEHKFHILRPGVVKTKIHEQTLRAGHKAANYERVMKIVNGMEPTTKHDEVYVRLKEMIL